MAAVTNPFVGVWTYRSFINDPVHQADVNGLLFGEGDLTVAEASLGVFAGRLNFGEDYQLNLRGASSYGSPFTIRFQGVGTDGSKAEGWVYDYLGHLVPNWPNGVDQRAAIVGSVIRTVPHSEGKAKAGYVASFIAIRQDVSPQGR